MNDNDVIVNPPPPELVRVSDKVNLTPEILDKMPRRLSFLVDPYHYAHKAIVCLKDQLSTAVSPQRKKNLQRKINEYQRLIDITEENQNVQKEG